MADFTLIKANPTQGEITSSLTGSTGDGAGLHLADAGQVTWPTPSATDFGTSDFSVEFILNQTEENTNGNYIYFSHTSANNRLYLHNDKSANDIAVIFVNSSGSSTGLDFTLPYDMSADYGTPTHYVFTFDRDGDVTLYKNGNSVASVSISAASAINLGDGNGNTGRFGSSTTYGVIGTFYRFRTFKTLADAKLLFERADVPRTLTANLLIDLDLAFANPSQSLTIQDRSTNNVDGTASSSTAVTQVQPVVQLNSTSARIGTTAATPADGAIIADKLGIGIAPSHAATIYGTGAGNATVQIEGEGGADPTINFLTNNTTHWAIGVDDSDSDNFKIVKHSAIGSTNNFLTIDSSGNVTVGDVEINGTYNLQLTDAANGGVSQCVMRQSRGTTASPVNSNANGDGNYISSQIYNSAYTTISQIGMVTGSAVNTGRLLFRTSEAGGALTTRLEIGSTGLATFNGGIVTSEKGIISGSVVIADEGVTTITPTRSGGFLEVHANTDDGTTGLYPLSNYSTKIFFDSGSSPANAKITTAIGADVDLTTSDVTGTTGTNGKVTIATLNNVIKIENQKGGTVKFFYTITC